MRLYEKHRPTTLDAVLGQDRAVTRLRRMLESGIGGRAFWISGSSGVGNRQDDAGAHHRRQHRGRFLRDRV